MTRALLIGSFLLAAFAPVFAQSQEPFLLVATPRDKGDVFDRARSVVRRLDEDFLREWRVARDRALAVGVKTLVLELTASDGDYGTTIRLMDDLADLRQNGVRVFVYVPDFATGPAALVALEADRVVLSESGRFGSADPAAIPGAPKDGRTTDDLRRAATARAAASARRNGYPALFVEAMIDPEVEVLAVRRPGFPTAYVRAESGAPVPPGASTETLVRKGDLLVLDRGKAAGYGFPVFAADARDQLRGAAGLEPRSLKDDEIFSIEARDSGPAPWAGFDWSLLLLAAGVVFLVLELKTPGVGVMGVLGVATLCAYFLVNGGGGPGSLFSIGFLLTGFLLLLIEILVLPGFGVAGVLGIALIVFSIYSATIGLGGATLREQLIPDSAADYDRVKAWLLQMIGTLLASVVAAILVAPRLHKFPILRNAFLTPPTLTPPDARVATIDGEVTLEPGVRGVAETDLRPSGAARLRERRVDVVADGEFVARGDRVVVVRVEGNRVVVRREDRAP
jgi:membrane-bound serine protease (ClpP class)